MLIVLSIVNLMSCLQIKIVKKKLALEGVHVVSASIMKSYCLCSSDPEKSHCKKMKRNLFKDQ